MSLRSSLAPLLVASCLASCLAGGTPTITLAQAPEHDGPAGDAARVAAEPVQNVVATDIQRTAALVAADLPALERLCSEELAFGHADGRVQSKAELLAALDSGEMRYYAINPGPRDVRLVAETVALVFGSAELLVGTAEVSHPLKIRYLAVYQRDARLGWRLAAYQSVRRTADE